MRKLVEKELSYKIVGVLFRVHRELGGSYQEKYYQRAVEIGLQNAHLSFERELEVDLAFDEENIGKYYLDFLVEGKVVLEIKAKPRVTAQDRRQVLAYLKARGVELGVLANFRGEKLCFERVLNSDFLDSETS